MSAVVKEHFIILKVLNLGDSLLAADKLWLGNGYVAHYRHIRRDILALANFSEASAAKVKFIIILNDEIITLLLNNKTVKDVRISLQFVFWNNILDDDKAQFIILLLLLNGQHTSGRPPIESHFTSDRTRRLVEFNWRATSAIRHALDAPKQSPTVNTHDHVRGQRTFNIRRDIAHASRLARSTCPLCFALKRRNTRADQRHFYWFTDSWLTPCTLATFSSIWRNIALHLFWQR